jgi:intracellular multiplication protein IcmT
MANYGGGAHWRDSARSPRFFMIDARASFFILFFLVHIQMWTGILALVNIVFFSIIEHYGFSIPVFFRWLRLNIAGPIKLSQPWWIE